MQIPFPIILFAVVAAAAAVDAPPLVHNFAGNTMFGEYKPKRPRSLNDIPEPVRTKVVTHLKQRLGEAFYSSIKFSGGQMVDFAEFHRVEPDWKDYQWEVFAYELHFEFRLPHKGIEFYQASIRLRSDGSVIQDIDLPNIAMHPERAEFVPLSRAIKEATANGFDVSHCRMEIAYRPKYDKCVYSFEQLVRRDGPALHFKRVDIDAHTGGVLRVYTEEGDE